MKTSSEFKDAIESHLRKLAFKDPLFAKSLKKEGKSLDDCITYILNQVKNSGNSGFTDDEIYGMAVHYYDEDVIDIGKPVKMQHVVVNHHPILSETEKEEIREKARMEVFEEEKKRLAGKKPTKVAEKKTTAEPATGSLF